MRDLENGKIFALFLLLAFTLPTSRCGAVVVTNDHGKMSCFIGPVNSETGNELIYNHAPIEKCISSLKCNQSSGRASITDLYFCSANKTSVFTRFTAVRHAIFLSHFSRL